MSTSAAPTTESPFDGDSDSVFNSKDTVLESDDSTDPNLPPPSKMASEEGFALWEWRRLNAISLAEKEKDEKSKLQAIIEEADEFKREFYSKQQTVIETRTASNREKQKQYLANQETFHAEAGKSYWKAIAELIPYEVATIERKGKNKDKQPNINLIMGPNPGKPTDLSRMRQVLVKLKHNPPLHMNPKPSLAEPETSSVASASPMEPVQNGGVEWVTQVGSPVVEWALPGDRRLDSKPKEANHGQPCMLDLSQLKLGLLLRVGCKP
ncbi:hypothetical protein V2J09_009453 [Rumex salicifolius]